MIIDQRHINYYKEIARMQYAVMIIKDYGDDSTLIKLTDSITNIYKYLSVVSFKEIIIYSALDNSCSLSTLPDATPVPVTDYDQLATFRGEEIVIELRESGDLLVAINYKLNIESIREKSIVYQFNTLSETEIFYGKNEHKKLIPIPDANSYFLVQTFKDLESAFNEYRIKAARLSTCPILETAWFNNERIFFAPKPEHILRDSLTTFLKFRLRKTEVRPEQVVDKSHPVDIKVTWSLTNHLAIIEIKWLGKSLLALGRRFNQIYTQERALSGAEQLKDYLDANRAQSPTKTTKGYLVIFDARRWDCNSNTTTISRENALYYENREIIFNPEYHKLRSDFAQPVRFFLEPIYQH